MSRRTDFTKTWAYLNILPRALNFYRLFTFSVLVVKLKTFNHENLSLFLQGTGTFEIGPAVSSSGAKVVMMVVLVDLVI